MNCIELASITGMECRPCIGMGEPALVVTTPFNWCDGEPMVFYILQQGSGLIVSDNGDTLSHLRSVGLPMTSPNKWRPVKSIAERFGLHMSQEGEIFTLASHSKKSFAVNNFIAALLALGELEKERIDADHHIDQLADDVESYLRMWKPGGNLIKNPKLRGQSTKSVHEFDFMLDDMVFAAIHPKPQSVEMLMRKISDTLKGPDSDNKTIYAIVDDRAEPELAGAEIEILNGVAKAIPLSKLISMAISPPANLVH